MAWMKGDIKMKETQTLFKRDTVFFLEDKNEYSDKEVLMFLGTQLFKLGYVKESFGKALVDREKVFPTGLRMKGYSIAIPHADLGHVYKPCIGVVRLKGTASFKDMIDLDVEVKAKFVFCIAIAEEQKQTDVLQNLMEIASDEEVMKQMEEAETEYDIYKILWKVDVRQKE